MNSKVYKWCAVPLCKNTSIRTPNKLFVHVPNKKIVRHKWLKLARRDPEGVVTNSPIYFCEDHFDLPNDMENYMQYHLMGSVSQVRMNPGCLPKKFACQRDRKNRTSDTIERPYISKKRKKMVLEEGEKQLEEKTMVTEHFDFEEIALGSSVQHNLEKAQQVTSKNKDKSIQIHKSAHIHKINNFVNRNPSIPSVSALRGRVKNKEQSDNDTLSIAHKEPSPTTKSIKMESASDCSELIEDYTRQEDLKFLEFTLKKITRNPYTYIGVPENCYYLINLLQKQTHIPSNHILLCLKKIRLNNSFRELADDFDMDATFASKIFFENIPILASVIRPLIVKLDSKINKRNIPIAFRHKFNKVSCIIDCMEIEVQKPSKTLSQALSWSDSKNAYTIKYLVSCTPNGLVNYISTGYGGQIMDTFLLESSDFINCLQPGMCVIADRGFQHVEEYLRKIGVLLVRPPSVVSRAKLPKIEAKETKQKASLRIPIERVIRRLQKFNMIKPHACLELSLVKILDDVVTIACGLINLQDSLIK